MQILHTFPCAASRDAVRLGILGGSAIAATLGILTLTVVTRRPNRWPSATTTTTATRQIHDTEAWTSATSNTVGNPADFLDEPRRDRLPTPPHSRAVPATWSTLSGRATASEQTAGGSLTGSMWSRFRRRVDRLGHMLIREPPLLIGR